MVDINFIKVRNIEIGDIYSFELVIDYDFINFFLNECMDFKSGEWVLFIDCVVKGIFLDIIN